jgi:hypothetical protein
MTGIDQGADVTIIAAAGNGPDYGLPGISRDRLPQSSLVVGNKVFVTVENPVREIRASKWDQRGW